ncbi:amino acid adenylation domain-containing protein [Actinospica robiniae]|uniref:amino acid adenylation domain-containing protein n=1 Tax=Actinospica robiniae TaxID=304901 RepID=UPI000404CE5E|nr:amino acid adenylation domain-containing protein [Actinospica robiniae]
MALWDGYDDVMFEVVVNAAGQDSIWPTRRARPAGWHRAGFEGLRKDCVAWIDRHAGLMALPPAGDESAGEGVAEAARTASAEDAALYGPRREVPGGSIIRLIRERGLPPDAVAFTCGTESLTRGEFFAASGAWAAVLREAGCGRETPVAILLPRGLDALVAIFAVLEAGGAYVPLSCADPEQRVGSILADCAAPIVVTSKAHTHLLGGYRGRVLTVEEARPEAPARAAAPARDADGDDVAYIFYTSGTTGEPKGVEGTHSQLVNYALWCEQAFAHEPGEVTFLSASLFFLGSLTTIFTPLLAGWPVVVAPDGEGTDELLALSGTVSGGLLKLTPTHIRMMMARGVPAVGLARRVMVGSEPLTFTPEIRDWMAADPRRAVANHYGLTETHGCFCHFLTGTEAVGSRVPVGLPIDNVEAFIVDAHGDLVGEGEAGELVVGGPSIARGYRNRPALTALRWIPHPWGLPGARLLRTGDLARMEQDGTVTVLGRADRQVKIRGHRVEPAAVEEALRAVPGVREALVLPRTEDGRVGLDAYLLRGPGAAVEPGEVRAELERRLPPPWIPSRVAVLDEFPVNANGKVDVRALPDPRPFAAEAPATESGRWSRGDLLVAQVYCDVLRLDAIALEDSFYDLGGDSLTSIEVAARLGQALGREVSGPNAAAATVRSYRRLIGLSEAGAAPSVPAAAR